MSKTKMLAAKELINEGHYDEARIILRSIDHPRAVEWLEILDRKYPSSTVQKAASTDLPKDSVPRKTIQALPQAAPVVEVEDEDEDEGEDKNLITPNHEKHNSFPKAIAGEFDGIQFRSQLEIRFAAELKKRGITYEYEPARVGKGNYMIDFYLPDFGIWVEVKGMMDARDEFMLQECADYLQETRMDLLYVYSNNRKMPLVHDDSLEYLWPGKFWDMLEAKQSQR